MNCPIDKENISLSLLFSIYLKTQNNHFKHIIKNDNITPLQIPILLKLLNHEYIHQKEISKALLLDNALLTRKLRKLEDCNYILRIEDDENRRQNKIKLTPKGYKIAQKLRNEGIKREEELFKNLNISRGEFINNTLDLIEESNKYNEEQGN